MLVPGRAVKLGSSLSTMLSLTVQPTWGTASTRARQPGRRHCPEDAGSRAGRRSRRRSGDSIRSPPSSSTPSPGMMRATGTPRHDDGAGVARDVAEDERDHPHSAHDVAPHAGCSSQPARLVVKVDRRRARVVRAGEGADHTLTHVGRLQALVVDVMFEALDHRPLEEHFPSFIVAGEAALELVAGWGSTDPEIAVALGPKGVSQPLFDAAKRLPAFQVRRCQAADFLLAEVVVVPELDAGAIVERNEHAGRAGSHWKP